MQFMIDHNKPTERKSSQVGSGSATMPTRHTNKQPLSDSIYFSRTRKPQPVDIQSLQAQMTRLATTPYNTKNPADLVFRFLLFLQLFLTGNKQYHLQTPPLTSSKKAQKTSQTGDQWHQAFVFPLQYWAHMQRLPDNLRSHPDSIFNDIIDCTNKLQQIMAEGSPDTRKKLVQHAKKLIALQSHTFHQQVLNQL